MHCGFRSQMPNPLRSSATGCPNPAVQSAISVKPRQSQSKCFPSTAWVGATASIQSATGQAPTNRQRPVLSDQSDRSDQFPQSAIRNPQSGAFSRQSRLIADDLYLLKEQLMNKLTPALLFAAALSAAAQPALTIYNQNFAVVRDSVHARPQGGRQLLHATPGRRRRWNPIR